MPSQYLLPNKNSQTLILEVHQISKLHEGEEVQSQPIFITGSEWTATAQLENVAKHASDNLPTHLNVSIYCNKSDSNIFWRCEAEIRIHVLGQDIILHNNFTPLERRTEARELVTFTSLRDMQARAQDDIVKIEVTIRVDSYTYLLDFSRSDPNMSEVVLVVEHIKLHVNKQILALGSPYFYNLFFPNDGETPKNEIEINGVLYERFVVFLNICYNRPVDINSTNVGFLLEFADRFEHSGTRSQCESFLESTNRVSLIEKLNYAQKHNLYTLQKKCLELMVTPDTFRRECADYSKVTPEMAHILLEKYVEIKKWQRGVY